MSVFEKKVSMMCIGAQKAGTSTLHSYLVQNRNLVLPNAKETHFFRDSEKFDLGEEWYFSQFPNSNDGVHYVEIDPEYSFFDVCADRIKQAFPDIKLVFILRNPVDRAFSHYMMTKRRGLEKKSFICALRDENKRIKTYSESIHFSYVQRGLYSNQLKRFEHEFGRENIMVFLFEDFCSEPKAVLRKIHDFLELPEYEYNTEVKSNIQAVSRLNWLSNLIWSKNKLTIFKKMIPSKKLRSYLGQFLDRINTRPLDVESKIKLSDKDKKSISEEFFADEINALELRLGIDLSSWRFESNEEK